MRLDVLLNNKDFNKYTASAIKFWSKKKKRKFNRIDIFLYAGLFFVLLFYLLGNDLMLNWIDFLTGFIAGKKYIVLFPICQYQTGEHQFIGGIQEASSAVCQKFCYRFWLYIPFSKR